MTLKEIETTFWDFILGYFYILSTHKNSITHPILQMKKLKSKRLSILFNTIQPGNSTSMNVPKENKIPDSKRYVHPYVYKYIYGIIYNSQLMEAT